jgi:GNAT superfamily N-acetyltransferase
MLDQGPLDEAAANVEVQQPESGSQSARRLCPGFGAGVFSLSFAFGVHMGKALSDNPLRKVLSIRHDLRPGDMGYLIYLHGILYAEEQGYDHTYEGYVAGTFAEFAHGYRPDKDRLWVAEMDGQIIGSIGIVGRSDEEAQLRWVLVHPKARGMGLGRMLMEEALKFCREAGYTSVYLWTVNGLTAAAQLYESVGFEKMEEKRHELWGHVLTEERYELRF